MFFKHFASKNQLPGLSISGTLVENGLRRKYKEDSIRNFRNPNRKSENATNNSLLKKVSSILR